MESQNLEDYADVPRYSAHFGIELPLLLEGVTVFDGSTLASVDDAQFLGRAGLPHPHVTIIGAAQYKPSISSEQRRCHADDDMSIKKSIKQGFARTAACVLCDRPRGKTPVLPSILALFDPNRR